MWPTASAGDAESAMAYARGNPSLVGAMYPTPAARDVKGRDRPERQGGQGLESALLYPTPTATAYGTNAGGQNPGPARPSIERLLLEQQRSETGGALYSTPTASNGGEAKSIGYNSSPNWTPAPTLADQVGTSSALCLNPGWVEHLMGFPPGWTDQQLAPRAGGGRRAAGKSRTPGKRQGSSRDPADSPTGGRG